MIQPRNNAGFTLVELTLSMAFISVLLLAIALLVLQVTSTYNRGLTLRAVNEAGRFVSTDIQRELNKANANQVFVVTQPEKGGRLCVGSTVYAWNFGQALDDDTAFLMNKFTSDDTKPVRLVKFQSDANSYCKEVTEGSYPSLPDTAENILVGGEKELAIHRFDIEISKGAADDADQTMYLMTLRIGTSEQSILDKSNDISKSGCEVPKGRIDDEYCAVNDFTFVARAGAQEVTSE